MYLRGKRLKHNFAAKVKLICASSWVMKIASHFFLLFLLFGDETRTLLLITNNNAFHHASSLITQRRLSVRTSADIYTKTVTIIVLIPYHPTVEEFQNTFFQIYAFQIQKLNLFWEFSYSQFLAIVLFHFAKSTPSLPRY